MAAIGIKKKKKGEEAPAGAPATEEGGEATAEGGKKKKEKGEGGGKSKLITIILIIVLVAAALFAGGVVMTKILLPSIMNDILKNVENNPGASEGEVIAEEEVGSELKLVGTHSLDEMTIQLAPGPDGTRSFLVIEMGVGFTDKKASAAFEEKKMEIKDLVLSTIMAKTKDELATENDMSSLKKVLAGKIQRLFAEDFKKNQIQVVISRYLIQ